MSKPYIRKEGSRLWWGTIDGKHSVGCRTAREAYHGTLRRQAEEDPRSVTLTSAHPTIHPEERIAAFTDCLRVIR